MFKGARARERLFVVVMWLVSFVLAGFLIGLGSLVIGDLPKVTERAQVEQFMDPARQAAINRERLVLAGAQADARLRLETAEQTLSTAQNAYNSARETFDNWVRTRSATADSSQDPEVLARTRELDRLKGVERTAEAARDAAREETSSVGQRVTANQVASEKLYAAAQPQFERAKFLQDLKIFGLRLALTLPLLAISAWMLLRSRGGDYWPLKRGFILFSAFAFFVELVPYLPDYGGYVRYAVGVIITVIVGHYVIKGMRAYLKAREADESRAEVERVRSIEYDEALKKKAANACPGCDRTLPTAEGAPIDYCVHCGMHLFNHCASCSTRKFAFFRYCMACGTPAAAEGPAA
jgi:predicted RNA-binding Zn-ribbon protein involved in translation (DUF1610 family)